VLVSGFNVYPREVEEVLEAHRDVVEAAVIGVPHPDFGEGVTAIVVPVKDAALTEETIMASVRGKLAKFKQPKRVLFVNELPRNTMGKVQKNVLREQYSSLYERRQAG